MANTTFNGPVRSENGFEQITKTAGTGAITTNLDIDSSGNLTTLPTAAAGLNYTFIVGTTFTGAGQINTDNASDLFSGFATIFDPATATDNNTFIPDASDDDTIDLGSAAQGWLVGGVIRLVATSAAVWHCEAFLHGDGTLATPFE